MAKEQLIIELIAEAKGAIKNLQAYTKEAKKTTKGVGALTKIFKGYFAEITAGVLIARKIVKVVSDLTKAYGLQETAIARVESALRATGTYTPTLSKELQQIASDLQLTSRFGDEATLQMAGLLQSLAKLNGEGLKETIPLVHDFAEGMGIDLNTAASLIGKTLGSTTNALSRYGIVLDMTGTKSEKLEALTIAINDSFGGMAKAMGETYAGQVTQLQNAFGDLKEVMGFFIADALTPMLKPIQKIITTTSTWLQSKKDLKEAYELLGKVAIEELDKISEAEATAAIKSIWAEMQKIEPIIKAYKENISSLTLEQKKNLTTYLSLHTELKKYLTTLSMEVTITDELAEKYGLKRRKLEDDNKATNGAIGLTIDHAKALEAAGKASKGMTSAIIAEKRAREEANEELERAMALADDYYGSYDTDYTPAVDNMTMAIEEANAKLADHNALIMDAAIPALQQFGKDLGDVALGSKDLGEALRTLAKDAFGNLLIAIGQQLLALAVFYTLTLQWVAAAAAVAGGLAAIAAGQIIKNLQQGGEVQHLQTGGFGDRVPAMLEPGEIVIDKFTAKKNAPAIGAMRGGESGGDRNVNLVLDGKVLAKWIWKESTNKNVTISARAVI